VTGQVLYDGFGGVLSSTLPFPPTSETGGTADVATGLVHMGDGRWLDPALGRPLQPNPNGGPTDIPQALNRFTATPFGQPGIAEATASSLNLTPMALATGAAKSAAFEVLARSTRGFFGRTVTAVVGRNSFIEINASSTALQRSLRVIEAEGGQLIGKIPQANRQLHQVRFRMNDGSLTEAILREQANLPTSGRFKASVSFTTEEVTESVVAARFSNLNGFKLGLATDILLGVGFQLYGDSHDPFLTTGQ